MPRCFCAKKEDKRDQKVRELIGAGMAREKMNKVALAEKMNMPYQTLRYHMDDLSKMRYEELRKIFDILKVPKEDRAAVL